VDKDIRDEAVRNTEEPETEGHGLRLSANEEPNAEGDEAEVAGHAIRMNQPNEAVRGPEVPER